MTAWLLAIGRMLGLGSFAGIRPSLTLAVIGVVSYFDWGFHANSTFSWLSNGLAIGIFVVLAILESTFDKISKLDRLQDRLIMPYRLVMGGVAGAATIPFGWKGVVIGAAVGAGASWFAQYTKHLSRPKSVPSEAVVALISATEDLGAFLGSVLVLAVPYAGYACVGVTGLIYWRMRDRRRVKYKQMRRAAIVRSAAGSGTPGGARVPPAGPGARVPVDAAAAASGRGPGPGGASDPGVSLSESPALELEVPVADVKSPARDVELPVADVERADDGG
jgi:uncharacterized membrane protein